MAGRAEAAGERVEGAQTEAEAKVKTLWAAFTGAGEKATGMAGRAEAAGERVEGAQTEAEAKVKTLWAAFTGAGEKATGMAGRAEAAGERVEGAQTEAEAKVKTLWAAFTGAGEKATGMAGRAEAAGERVEGAQTEAEAKVKTLWAAFTGAGEKATGMAGRAEAAGERVEGAQTEAEAKVKTLWAAFTGAGEKATGMAGRAEAAGERVEGAQTEAEAKVKTLWAAFTGAGEKATGMAGRAEAAGERVEGAQTEAEAKVKKLWAAFTGAGEKATGMAGRTEAAGERVEGAAREAQGPVKRLGDAFLKSGDRATTMGQKAVAARRRITGAVGSLGAAFGIAGGAFAIGASAKRIASIETRMERLGIQSSRSTEEMNALRGEIYEVANAPDIRVDPSQLTAAVEAIVEKTGDLDFARNNLRLIAEAIQGSGGTGDALGRMAAEFRKLGVVSDEEVGRMLNLLVVQGKSGAFTLGDVATQGERVFSAFAGLGYEGPAAVRQLGAIVQIARQATPSAEQAATAVEGYLRTLSDAKKLGKIENELGVQVRLGDGSFRDPGEILAEIVKAVDGDVTQLSEIFDETARKLLNVFVTDQGRVDYRRFRDIEVRGDELETDAARIANTTEAAAQDVRTSFEAKLTEHFTGPLRDTALSIAEFQGEILAAASAGFILSGAFKAAKGAAGLLSRSRGKGIGEAVEAAGDADFGGDPREGGPKRKGRGGTKLGPRLGQMHVGTLIAKRMVGGGKGRGIGGAVVAGGGDDAESGKKRGRGSRAGMGRGAGLGSRGGLGRGAGLGASGGAVLGAIGIAESLASGDTENLVEDVAGLVGSVIGGALGAAGGTAVLPGIGTAVGGTAGAVAGDALARELFDEFGGVVDRFQEPGPGLDAETARAYRTRNFAGQHPEAQVRDLEPAPSVAALLRTRGSLGNARDQSQVRVNIGTIISNASDPKQVAADVADEIERRQRDQRIRIDDGVAADGPSEIIF